MGTLQERQPVIYGILKDQTHAQDKWLPNRLPDGKYGKATDYCAGKSKNWVNYYPALSDTASAEKLGPNLWLVLMIAIVLLLAGREI